MPDGLCAFVCVCVCVRACVCVCVFWCIYTHVQGWQVSLCNQPNVCMSVCIDASLCVLIQVGLIIAVYKQIDATPSMYLSPKMGQMHEQEMKSLNLVVGNGIRKH